MSCKVTKVSDFFAQNKKPSCKTPTNSTVDGFTVRAQAFECLNGPNTPAVFPS
jgi:hypothetical protein